MFPLKGYPNLTNYTTNNTNNYNYESTNFISQCLCAGGKQYGETPFQFLNIYSNIGWTINRTADSIAAPVNSTELDTWNRASKDGWNNADFFYNYWKYYAQDETICERNELNTPLSQGYGYGNIVQINVRDNANGVIIPKYATIITGNANNSYPSAYLLTSHCFYNSSSNSHNVSLQTIMNNLPTIPPSQGNLHFVACFLRV